MPIYEYKSREDGCEHCRVRFEVLQKITEPPLTHCPECGEPVHRIYSSVAIVTTERQLLSKSNLESKGWGMYKKAGDGVYEKAAGKGLPDTIHRDGES
jgi:putative FmdB family regulatory protein